MKKFEQILDKFISENSLVEQRLNFCHSTKYKILIKHIIPSKLILRPINKCAYHGNKKLLFFYYGKASFIPKDHVGGRLDKTNPPIALIYDDIFDCSTVDRLCSFDSGAYIKGYLTKNIKPNPVTLADFMKNKPSKDDLIASVQCLYGTNENYLANKLNLKYTIKDFPTSLFLLKYDELEKEPLSNLTEYGPQAFSIEAQVSTDLNKNPIAIAVPSTSASNRDAIKEWNEDFPNATVLPYDFKPERDIRDAYYEMTEVVLQFNKKII